MVKRDRQIKKRVLGRHATRAGALRQERAIAVRERRSNGAPSYTASHWGRRPEDSFSTDVPEPRDNNHLITLGWLHSVVYITRKGSDPPEGVEYEHKFSHRNPPLLCYGSDDGRLYLVGGSYRMTRHGIIG
jgi:hypothetical protein